MNTIKSLVALAVVVSLGASFVSSQERQTDSMIVGTAVAKPDLIVAPALPVNNIKGLAGTGYCGPYNPQNPTLLFRVENNGSAETGPILVHVGFKPQNKPIVSMLIDIPNVASGQSLPRSVKIPAEAFGSGHLQFTVFADSTNQADESVETNNHDAGYCLQPEG